MFLGFVVSLDDLFSVFYLVRCFLDYLYFFMGRELEVFEEVFSGNVLGMVVFRFVLGVYLLLYIFSDIFEGNDFDVFFSLIIFF